MCPLETGGHLTRVPWSADRGKHVYIGTKPEKTVFVLPETDCHVDVNDANEFS
jgi:hypothetical protein